MNKQWNLLSEEEAKKYTFLNVHIQKYEKVATKDLLDILVVSSGDAANVIPITKALDVILVKQFRFGIQKETLEIPGGLIDIGETPLDGIKRELSEETGYTSPTWKQLGKMPFNPVYHKNYIHHFIATDVVLTDATNHDIGESIEIIKMPLAKVLHEVKQGQLAHPHTISAFMLAYDQLKTLIP